MDDQAAMRFLIVLTSNSDEKTLRFLISLTRCLSKSPNRHKWHITVLRPPPYNTPSMLLPASLVSHLHKLNVAFLQPHIHLLPATPFRHFLFCAHNGSHSIAAQRNHGLLAAHDYLQITTADLIAVLDDDLVFENALLKQN